MENEKTATVRFVLDTVTKKWVWKLSDETGSTVAKSPVQYDTEELAKEAFTEFQTDGPVATEAEIAPAQTPVEPTPEVPVEPTPEVPVEPTAPEAPTEPATVEPEVPADAGTTEPAPVEDAGSVI